MRRVEWVVGGPVFQYAEGLFGVAHADGAEEVEVVEAVDHEGLLGRGELAAVGDDVEFEGGVDVVF